MSHTGFPELLEPGLIKLTAWEMSVETTPTFASSPERTRKEEYKDNVTKF